MGYSIGMPLAAGHRLGPYEIVAPVGAGGMGEVYKARDTRLDRTVAIKVLPAHLAANAELRQRFEREARVISSLNHPHICQLHDIGKQDGIDYLVMEFLEGETLSARLVHGPMPLDQLLTCAVQMAGALAEAHGHGVSHRDLKPGNVMLTRAGAKLLDFGLAKIAPASRTAATVDISPTQSLTAAGSILGTFQYMSPELLQGKDADPRSDIFAFGAVVYEMATGRKAFEAQTPAALAGAIIHTEPAAIPSHPLLDRVVRKCLAKDPEARWQSAAELRSQLQWIAEGTAPAVPVAAPRVRTPKVAWTAAAVFFVLAATIGVIHFRESPPEQQKLKVSILPPEKASFGSSLAISPDGRRLAFPATGPDGRTQLWVRPLDSLVAQPLSGTEGASLPFWSPDSQSLGFFSGGKLKRIDLAGGPPQTLADASQPRGASWSRAGIIGFAPTATSVLFQAPATGGEVKPLTSLDSASQENNQRWPHFLPDGRHFLYLIRSRVRQNAGIFAGSLDSKTAKRILNADSSIAYADGRLLFVREGSLMAQPFDAQRLETTGPAVPVAEQVPYSVTSGAPFSVSANGILGYRSGGGGESMLRWFDRGGKPLGQAAPPAIYIDFDLSPDEKQVVVGRGSNQGDLPDIWLLDLTRNTPTRFTFDPALDWYPVWSRDGSRIAFSSQRGGSMDLYAKVASGAGADELLLKSPEPKIAADWSPDGRLLLYQALMPKTGMDFYLLPLAGERKPMPYLETPFNERQGRFSPDGRWVAYTSDESGPWQVYVQPFPASGAKWQISATGGADPRWRGDGKELFYLAPDRKLMAVDVKAGGAPSGTFQAGVPQPLFDTRFPGAPELGRNYAPAANGQRFLLSILAEESAPPPITVVVNWNRKN